MGRKSVRLVVLGCGVVVLAAAGLWAATGANVWTRFPSAGIAEAQAEPEGGGLDDLFADAGLNDDHGELEEIDNEFRFGLLPSGAGREALSVASVGGAALAVAGGVWWLGRRKTGALGGE